MNKATHRAAVDPPIITVGELIDELCRLPDTAVVHFLRKRSKDAVEIAVNVYPESPPVVASSGAVFDATTQSPRSPPLRESALLRKARG